MYFAKKQYVPTPLPKFADTKDKLTSPIYDDNPLYVQMYWRTWELAFKNFYEPRPGTGFVSQYINAGLDSVWATLFEWDRCFMSMFCKYGHPLVPAVGSLDNFYARQHEDGEICREIRRSDGADYVEWVNDKGEGLFSRWGWNLSGRDARKISRPVVYIGRATPQPNPKLTLDGLNHPILAWAELDSYQLTGDRDRLARVWDPLYRYYAALQKYLLQGNGLYITDWASMDNSPRNIYLIDGGTGLDISAEMVMFARQMAEIGSILGKKDQAQRFSREADALAALKAPADFDYAKPREDTELAFVHRKLSDGDVYWVSHRNARAENVTATFRIQGKAPELWHAETGAVEPAAYMVANGRTIVPLNLQPNDAVFVVFRKPADARSRTLPEAVETTLKTVDGAWDVAFQPNRGAPAEITLPALASWHENSDPGVKYFSGIGTYSKTIQAAAQWFQPGAKLYLDLGDVKNIAQVAVNGKPLGIYWKAPFRVDVTSALKPGANALEIKVTDLWVNRLIGDQQSYAVRKYTFTDFTPYKADSPLLPSGLLGPVRIITEHAHSLTGIDISGEKPGLLPTPAWKKQVFKRPQDQIWFPGETVNFGIGQGYLLVTPLQLAHMAAELGERGKSFKPRVVMAGVPKRIPDASMAGRGSKGMVERLQVMPARSKLSSAALPVTSLGVRSTTIRWLSVPPATMFMPAAPRASASTLALAITWRA